MFLVCALYSQTTPTQHTLLHTTHTAPEQHTHRLLNTHRHMRDPVMRDVLHKLRRFQAYSKEQGFPKVNLEDLVPPASLDIKVSIRAFVCEMCVFECL